MDQGVPGRIGRYEVEELVVTSSFSQVWRARDPGLAAVVAIKLFRVAPEKLADPHQPYGEDEWRRRFVAEARALARIDHPNVVRVNALDRLADGRPYMVMPYLVANLRREIGRDAASPEAVAALPEGERPRAVAPARAAAIVAQLCWGLAALHAQGFVHRDVKPTNLLLTRREGGDVKLCDLGMVRLPNGGESRAGAWIGTLDYSAPEQKENAAAVTDRADVYSAGVLAYRLLTGRLPQGAFPPAATLVPGLPREFDALIHQALAPDPWHRPTAADLARRLAALFGHFSATALRTAGT